MSSRAGGPLGAKPRVRVAPRYSISDGEDAVFLASAYGLTADPWQADILDDWLGRKKGGGYAATLCGLCASRQNGKNGCIEIRELFGMIELGEKFLHTAHEVKTARKAFKRLKWFFGNQADDPNARFPELNALVVEVRNTNGQEAILLKNGGSVEFVARSKGSGRGYTVDVIVLDEAQFLTDEELESILSTISAAEQNPQLIVTGTAPNPEKGETAEVFTRVRAAGNAKAKATAWADFGVRDGPLPDIEDRALLAATNPALDTRLHQEVIDLELTLLSPEGFARERLGWWGDPAREAGGVIDLKLWAKRKHQGAEQPDKAGVVLDVAPDRRFASLGIAAAGREGRILVLVRTAPGTAWVVPALLDILSKRTITEVTLHPQSQAGPMIPDLVAAGIEFQALTTRELGQACGWFQKQIEENGIEHVGQKELDAAIGNASTRYSGEAELWDRRDRRIDISPLVAVSVAAFRWSLNDDYDVTESIF